MGTLSDRLRLAFGVLALVLASISCSDPARDAAVERLGPEVGGVSPGPLHRPGQPCLVCHSERGPASDKPFAMAGTVFEKRDSDAPPTPPIEVHIRDADGALRVKPTNEVGNFYITEDEWFDFKFPLKVALRRDGKIKEMKSPVNREGSCNFCHKPASTSKYSLSTDEPRTSIGQIDFEGALTQ